VYSLYDAQPNQCSTCGRRFLATDAGRAQKARHLDWHFRTNQRMADASIARGAHRDWFVNEMEWISLSDFDPSTADPNATAAAAKKGERAKAVEESFVRAPPGVTKNVCSIDFEEMRASYSEELQEWVFTNATTWQGKIVHATCLAELQKGSQQSLGGSWAAALSGMSSSRQRSATPDSSLGKRKAEGALAGSSARLRMD
jgi:pre-mRNA cleavage complex 2 protein Pcf11